MITGYVGEEMEKISFNAYTFLMGVFWSMKKKDLEIYKEYKLPQPLGRTICNTDQNEKVTYPLNQQFHPKC